jgi:hypothetical protein
VRSTHGMPFNTDRRLFHGRPRPSFLRFGSEINGSRTLHLVVAQISRSMMHRVVDATTGPYGHFDRVVAGISSGWRAFAQGCRNPPVHRKKVCEVAHISCQSPLCYFCLLHFPS